MVTPSRLGNKQTWHRWVDDDPIDLLDWVGGVIVRSGLFEGQLWVVGQLVDVYVERWRKLSVRIELLKLGARTGGAGDQSLAQGRSTFDRIIVVFAC